MYKYVCIHKYIHILKYICVWHMSTPPGGVELTVSSVNVMQNVFFFTELFSHLIVFVDQSRVYCVTPRDTSRLEILRRQSIRYDDLLIGLDHPTAPGNRYGRQHVVT